MMTKAGHLKSRLGAKEYLSDYPGLGALISALGLGASRCFLAEY